MLSNRLRLAEQQQRSIIVSSIRQAIHRANMCVRNHFWILIIVVIIKVMSSKCSPVLQNFDCCSRNNDLSGVQTLGNIQQSKGTVGAIIFPKDDEVLVTPQFPKNTPHDRRSIEQQNNRNNRQFLLMDAIVFPVDDEKRNAVAGGTIEEFSKPDILARFLIEAPMNCPPNQRLSRDGRCRRVHR